MARAEEETQVSGSSSPVSSPLLSQYQEDLCDKIEKL